MIFLPFHLTNVSADAYKIIDIDRVSVFAGKMGNEVYETLVVEKGGKNYTVTISPYHTNVARTPLAFEKGEMVKISGFMREDHIKTSISEIKR